MKKRAKCVECGVQHSNHLWIDGQQEPEINERCFNCEGIVSMLRVVERAAGKQPLLGGQRKLTIEKYKIEKV